MGSKGGKRTEMSAPHTQCARARDTLESARLCKAIEHADAESSSLNKTLTCMSDCKY